MRERPLGPTSGFSGDIPERWGTGMRCCKHVLRELLLVAKPGEVSES